MLWGGRWKMWCVYVSLCRGVLNTPYKRPSEGGRESCHWSWTGIRHPWDGALWGVCHTPLPCYPKNDHGQGMFYRVTPKIGCLWGILWGGRWKMWCVFMSPCRGVLHTPYKRPSEGGRGPCLWSCTGIRHPWDGALWGVCHTPLP